LNFSAASAITLTLSRQRQGRGTSSAWAASRAECSTRPCNTPRTRRCRAGGALSDAERRAVYRLRHDQVTGDGWAECDADGLEHDAYDIDALHICAWRGPDLVGTVRVVLPVDGRPLPVEAAFGVTVEPRGAVAEAPQHVAEVGRQLLVRRPAQNDWRRRRPSRSAGQARGRR